MESTVLREEMDILKDLNPAQRQAVQAIEGPVLVLAGPGSGKTRVLTHRVAYLVGECSVSPYNIMAVTFTNKAAQEMKGRLDHLLGQRLRGLTIGTFHAICSRTLRREAERLEVSSDFVIYDRSDQLGLVRQALKDLNLDDKMYRPQAMLGTISRAKNELIGPESFAPQTYWQEVAGRVYTRYQELLLANNAQDFDDLLMNAVRLFTQHPDVLAKYQRRYFHILVDEFQDTNTAQYALVKRLAEKKGNLFAVGDEDQSIYAFRGADFRNVHRFRRDYPDARVVLLEPKRGGACPSWSTRHTTSRRRPNTWWTKSRSWWLRGRVVQGTAPSCTAPMRSRACWRTPSSGRACPTSWWGPRDSTPAARSRMSWPTCAWCTIPTIASVWLASSTCPRGALGRRRGALLKNGPLTWKRRFIRPCSC
jgi:hypothetical protein